MRSPPRGEPTGQQGKAAWVTVAAMTTSSSIPSGSSSASGASPGHDPSSAGRSGGEATLAQRAGDQGLRALVLVAGLGLLGGFFLPWLSFGEFAAVSGLSLLVSSGTVVEALSGPSRGLLVMIPVCGTVLVASGVLAPRLAPVAALASGVAILAFGLFTLARVFFQTVGLGMWLVVGSSLLAAAVGIAAWARKRAGRSA